MKLLIFYGNATSTFFPWPVFHVTAISDATHVQSTLRLLNFGVLLTGSLEVREVISTRVQFLVIADLFLTIDESQRK
jgi:hypothetical protein